MKEDVSIPQEGEVSLLDQLAWYSGEAAGFWADFFAYLAGLSKARTGLTAVRAPDGSWRQVQAWPETEGADGTRDALRGAAARMAEGVIQQGALAVDLAVDGFRLEGLLLGIRLPVPARSDPAAVFLHREVRLAPAERKPLLDLLSHAVLVVVAFQSRLQTREAAEDARRFGSVLDLLAALRDETRFVSASMKLCNEVAGRYGCDRVSLGWRKGDYIRLVAVSHAENFEKRMDAVRCLETAMEEALDQDEEVLWPPPTGSGFVSRAHATLAREQGANTLISLPFRPKENEEPEGVLTCEREQPFRERDISHLRLIADQAAPVMAGLRARDQWFWKRWWAALGRAAGWVGEPRHTGLKAISVGGAIALAVFFFFLFTFRVQAPFLLRAESAVYLPAPFDGYLAEVMAEPGDLVGPGQGLVGLDTRELRLEEAAAIAERDRFLRESEKARAEHALASMRIAMAQAEQADVRLALIRHHLGQAQVTSPMNGVVVEGDLRERIGSPVRKGDLLMRVARLDSMWVELEVEQRDLGEIREGAEVRLVFAGRPGQSVAAVLEKIEPQAEIRDGKNVFAARCRLQGAPESWMRPGMTGVGKVEAGQRTAAWMISRKTVDFLRLHLWW